MFNYKFRSNTIKVPPEFENWQTLYYVLVGDTISNSYDKDEVVYKVVNKEVDLESNTVILWVE
jgi:hypothetical protein